MNEFTGFELEVIERQRINVHRVEDTIHRIALRNALEAMK